MAEVIYRALSPDQVVTLMAQGWVLIEDTIGQWLFDGHRYEVLDDGIIEKLMMMHWVEKDEEQSKDQDTYKLLPLGIERASRFTDTGMYVSLMQSRAKKPPTATTLLLILCLMLPMLTLAAVALYCLLCLIVKG